MATPPLSSQQHGNVTEAKPENAVSLPPTFFERFFVREFPATTLAPAPSRSSINTLLEKIEYTTIINKLKNQYIVQHAMIETPASK
jgi:hypothetical protein